jgi:DNA-directed RNA polymerase subunit RPC12/RpoP
MSHRTYEHQIETVVVMPVIRYRCPDCGQEVETLTAQPVSDDCDAYKPVLCPKCQQLPFGKPGERRSRRCG